MAGTPHAVRASRTATLVWVVAAGVDDHGAEALRAGLLDPGDQLAFVIGLAGLDSDPKLRGEGVQAGVDIREGFTPVDLRLAGAEQVQVRSV